jgi:putative transcriptional regulator
MKNRIKLLRVERDLSQAQLADELGIARQTVVALEAGKYAPSLPLAFKISRLFQKPVEDIFDPDSDQTVSVSGSMTRE